MGTLILAVVVILAVVLAASKMASIQVDDEISEIEHEVRMESIQRQIAEARATRESWGK